MERRGLASLQSKGAGLVPSATSHEAEAANLPALRPAIVDGLIRQG